MRVGAIDRAMGVCHDKADETANNAVSQLPSAAFERAFLRTASAVL